LSNHAETAAPSPWVTRFTMLAAPGGRVLDVACGTGRHVRYFLSQGHPVTGLDRYNAGVVDLLGRDDFELIDTDLEDGRPWAPGSVRFAVVVVTNYLYRPILPEIIAAVADDGVLVYETFAVGNERHGRPSNPDFLLRPGELLDAIHGKLDPIAFEQGEVQAPRPAVVQRICAVGTGYSTARRLDGMA
jgi:SAM-dependent methyltransferase